MSGRRVAIISTYPPRLCGVGVYASTLYEALAARIPVDVFALDEGRTSRRYGSEVKYSFIASELGSYLCLSKRLGGIYDCIIVQHEYGLFGGEAGSHLLRFMALCQHPVVVAMHTVLARPSRAQRRVTMEMCARAAAVVVFSAYAYRVLELAYKVSPTKIHHIRHGTVRVPPSAARSLAAKAALGLSNRKLLVSAGFLGPNKGLEYGLGAFAKAAGTCREAHYVIIGQSHPQDSAASDYEYRLRDMINSSPVRSRIRLVHRYVSDSELNQWLIAADVCLLPYTEPRQVSSGMLARCLGLGRAVVASDFPYAAELLRGGAGILVPMADTDALSEVLAPLLSSPSRIRSLQRSAFEYTRNMGWSNVGREYLRLLEDVRNAEERG